MYIKQRIMIRQAAKQLAIIDDNREFAKHVFYH